LRSLHRHHPAAARLLGGWLARRFRGRDGRRAGRLVCRGGAVPQSADSLRARHTAIIPSNKERIADNLAVFVEEKFLKPESLAAVILKTDPATNVAEWLKAPANRDYLAAQLARLVPEILATADDARIQQLLKDALHAAIGKLDMAPALGTVIAGLTREGRHQELLDDGMRALIGILNRPSTREVIAELIVSWLKREHAAMELVLPTEWISERRRP
jgi:uncharacterized membrane-anchored protein YjiN (DUF445 family)